MPQALQDVIRRVRANVDEPAYPTLPNSVPNAPPFRMFTDTELTDWVNDGLRDVSRRAEELITFDTSMTVQPYVPVPGASAPLYPLPGDVIRIQRIEFVPFGAINQTYPLVAATQWEMDQVWGTYQQNPASYPQFWVTHGYSGGTGRNAFQLQIYPVPSQGGTLQLYYYRLPIRIGDPVSNPSNYLTPLDIAEGWDDAVVDFATYKALQKQRNPEWQERKAEYEEKVAQMVDVTRKWTDQPSYFSFGTRFMPSWLTEWDS